MVGNCVVGNRMGHCMGDNGVRQEANAMVSWCVVNSWVGNSMVSSMVGNRGSMVNHRSSMVHNRGSMHHRSSMVHNWGSMYHRSSMVHDRGMVNQRCSMHWGLIIVCLSR